MRNRWTAASLILLAAACSSPQSENQAQPDEPAPNGPGSGSEAKGDGKAGEIACPFRQLQDLRASISGGRLLVTGRVDFMMAGFKPQLSPRPGSSGPAILDLDLVPEPQAPISDTLRFERSGVSAARSGEIWCGGEKLTDFSIMLAG